jgi:hypothetical protein
MTSLIWQGFKKALEFDDLFDLVEDDQAQALANRFEEIWRQEASASASGTVSLLRVLWEQFGRSYAAIGIFHLIQAASSIASPIIISNITLFAQVQIFK